MATTPDIDRDQPWLRRKRDDFRRRVRLVRAIGYAPTGLLIATIAAAIVAGLLPVAFILAGGVLAAEIQDALAASGDPSLDGVVRAFVLLLGLFLVSEVMLPVQGRLRWLVGQRIDGVARHRSIRSALAGTDMSHLHDEEMLRGLWRVRGIVREAATPGMGGAAAFGVARDYLIGLASSAVVLWFDPWIGAMTLLVSLVLRITWRSEVIAIIDAWIEGLDAMGEARYFVELGLGRHAALEVRLFGLRDWIRQRIEASGIRGWMPTWRNRTLRLGRMSAVHIVLSGGAALIALRWAADAAIRGELSIPDLVVFVPALFAALALGRVFDDDTAFEYGSVTLPGLERVERGAARAVSREGGRRSTDPDVPPTIELHDVSFRYPGSDQDVLRDVSLRIPAGTSAALVGLNGAGKTTLVRLLCGLYAPDRGRVTVDGIDMRELDLEAWHRRIAPMFQEFVRLQVSLRENVTAGAPERPVDDRELRDVLADAGAAGFAARLPDGVDTSLATPYADGADLSGGQWQRLGVARALYALRAGARFLILDEPTSNLDTSSEERLVERMVEGTAGEATTLLVTHRLSLARRTDRIFVLERGRLVEDGTHEELLERGGRYADAFLMQAAMYPLEASDA